MRVTTITCDDCLKVKLEKDIIYANNRDYCRNCARDRLLHSFSIAPKKDCKHCKGTGSASYDEYGDMKLTTCEYCKGTGYKLGD